MAYKQLSIYHENFHSDPPSRPDFTGPATALAVQAAHSVIFPHVYLDMQERKNPIELIRALEKQSWTKDRFSPLGET